MMFPCDFVIFAAFSPGHKFTLDRDNEN
jgi:hypothetical protein